MNYTELVNTLNAIEAFFRDHKVHEQFIEAVTISKRLAERQMHPDDLVRIDVSAEETKFNCPNCGFTYFRSQHPRGYDVSKIQLTSNDNHCIACGKRISLPNKPMADDVITSEYIS